MQDPESRPFLKYLITGSQSGLGRYLHEKLGGVGVTRESTLRDTPPPVSPYSAVIHCAFNIRRDIDQAGLYGYLEDTLLLTKEAACLPSKKFIFISSIDVYPDTDDLHSEEADLSPLNLHDMYAIFKLTSESIVRHHCPNHLILRPGLLLGPYMRPNNLTRIVRGDPGRISLSRESGFYCVLYSDILQFMVTSLDQDIQGTFNAVRSDVVTMGELATRFRKEVQFGTYNYMPKKISNARISSLCPCFTKTSLEAVQTFVEEFQ